MKDHSSHKTCPLWAIQNWAELSLVGCLLPLWPSHRSPRSRLPPLWFGCHVSVAVRFWFSGSRSLNKIETFGEVVEVFVIAPAISAVIGLSIEWASSSVTIPKEEIIPRQYSEIPLAWKWVMPITLWSASSLVSDSPTSIMAKSSAIQGIVWWN